MSLLVLVRHGRAAFGAARYDTLSPLGRAQAAATGEWLAAHRPDVAAIWRGPRRRHAETASEIARAGTISAAVREHPGLDEFAEGEEVFALARALEEDRPATGATDADLARRRAYEQAVAAWAAGRASLPGRPGFPAFRRRVRDWFADVTSVDAPRGRTELVVTSAGVIAAIACDVLDLPDHRWLEMVRPLLNASLTEVAFSGGRIGLRSFNACGHLAPALISAI